MRGTRLWRPQDWASTGELRHHLVRSGCLSADVTVTHFTSLFPRPGARPIRLTPNLGGTRNPSPETRPYAYQLPRG